MLEILCTLSRDFEVDWEPSFTTMLPARLASIQLWGLENRDCESKSRVSKGSRRCHARINGRLGRTFSEGHVFFPELARES